MPIFWHPEALGDLADIITYIARDNPPAARALKSRIEEAAAAIARHPTIYRTGRVPGTRELVVHPNYILIYQVLSDRIQIVGVWHARRRYP